MLPFRAALVTGASSGIGAAFVAQLAGAGVPVVVVARREDRLRELAERHAGVEVLAADLTVPADLQRVAVRLTDPDRPIDLLVNNAGFGTSGSFADLAGDRLDREIDLNVRALVRLTHAALPGMVARGRGWVINVSSVAGFQPAPRLAVYAATKAFVTSLSESLHEEVRGSGVVVTALCPGLTRTEFQSVSSPTGAPAEYPDALWLDAGDVAAAALADVSKGRAISVPGAVYKVMVAASRLVPRSVVRRVSATNGRRRP